MRNKSPVSQAKWMFGKCFDESFSHLLIQHYQRSHHHSLVENHAKRMILTSQLPSGEKRQWQSNHYDHHYQWESRSRRETKTQRRIISRYIPHTSTSDQRWPTSTKAHDCRKTPIQQSVINSPNPMLRRNIIWRGSSTSSASLSSLKH